MYLHTIEYWFKCGRTTLAAVPNDHGVWFHGEGYLQGCLAPWSAQNRRTTLSLGEFLDYGESLTEEELKEAVVFRPYWVFTNRLYYMRDNTGGNYDAHENTVFVDAVTGDVLFCNVTSIYPF